MFKKMKSQIQLLTDKIETQRIETDYIEESLRRIKFQLHTTPKFKKGDKIRPFVVIGFKIKERTNYGLGQFIPFLSPTKSFYWEYECFDRDKSEKVFLSEDELEKKGAKQ